MNPNFEEIGQRIRKERLAAKISQAALAEIADVSPQYICLVENGKKQLSLTVLVRISDALSVSVDQLLFDVSDRIAQADDKEASSLLHGCNAYESRVILDIALAAKRSLTENRQRLLSIV